MKELTCRDCGNWNDEGRGMATCRVDGHVHDHNEEMCQNFLTKDGKRPRFCRLASSVEEMAAALVFFEEESWFFTESGELFDTFDDAVSAAKAWLMEVEE